MAGKETFIEGNAISLQTSDGIALNGMIILLRNDTIFLNQQAIPARKVTRIILSEKEKIVSLDEFIYMSLGVAIVTGGMLLSGLEEFEPALIYACVMGYGQLLIRTSSDGSAMEKAATVSGKSTDFSFSIFTSSRQALFCGQ